MVNLNTNLNSINFQSPELRANPYPIYRLMRESSPVLWLQLGPDFAFYALTRYRDVEAVLRDPRFGRFDDTTGRDEWRKENNYVAGPLDRLLDQWMLFRNPPDHTRLRGLVSRAFTPRMVESLRARIEAIVKELLDAAEAKGDRSIELIAELAYPLPVRVIAEMMGVPLKDREQFKVWSDGVAGILDVNPPMDVTERAVAIVEPFKAYFADLVELHRRQPKSDMLSALIEAEDQGDKLTEEELLAQCILLLVAGHETTKNLIGNGTLALLQNPNQLAKLRATPGLIRNAVEELLRYDSPVQATFRMAMTDAEVASVQVKRFEWVMTALGAANRDPEVFPDPDRLDIERPDVKPMSFGGGIHYCVGAPLARVEAQIAINALLQRFPNLRLATDQLEWQENYTLRGLKQLPLAF